MWVGAALLSALLLGFYDVAKKRSLAGNAVIPVLLLNTLFSSLLLLPYILDAHLDFGWFGAKFLQEDYGYDIGIREHLLVALKAAITLSSWLCGYYAIKHLPLTIVGPVNATRPVVVLLGAILLFGEELNLWQWGGVLLTIVSLYLLSRAGRKENIDFRNNRYVWAMFAAMLLGAVSGLYDKFLISRCDIGPIFVQSWFGIYQFAMMCIIGAVIWLPRRATEPFHWRWTIPLISLFVTLADFCYYHALDDADSMIAVVSMIRRSSVIVTFLCGALLFGERNLKTKALDLLLILVGMVLLCIGSV
ncbi:MAG: EamA family transporter [Alistipes sp.]|nr:EamA family transporter [Alistipes sp.]